MDQDVKTLNQRLAELQQDVAQKEELAVAVAHQRALAHLPWSWKRPAIPGAAPPASECPGTASQRAHDVARRLQQVQHELLEVDQQLTVHQRRMADYEAILQRESTILAGYRRCSSSRAGARV